MGIIMAETALYLIFFALGAVIASFINVVIYRVPLGISIAKGRSFCPQCHHKLCAIDLVPIFSFAVLGGKCRYCGAKISARYPIIEFCGGLCGVVCTMKYGINLQATVAFAALILLLAIAMVDIDTMEIPNGLVLAMAAVAVLGAFAFGEVSFLSRAIGLACGFLPFLILTLIIKDCFGGGDIKLMAACGFLLGAKCTIFAIFVAIVSGGIYGIYLLLTRRVTGKDHFAFGPFLAAGCAAALLWGNSAVAWYLGLMGF